ncbi:multidrug resistance protein 1-like protein, partial [Leptotrombidium deliense]
LNVQEEEEIESHGIKELFKLVFRYKIVLLFGCIGAVGSGSLMPGFSIVFGEILSLISSVTRMRNETTFYALIFVLLGVVYCISCILQNYCFGVISERITKQLRERVFDGYLQQDIAFFDDHNNSVGALCARLSSDASAVQGASGARISIVVQAAATLVAVITISMIYNWKLGLVTLSMLPLQLTAAIAETVIIRESLKSDSKSDVTSTKIAIETLSNIRTVVSLRLEDHFYRKFQESLSKSDKKLQVKCHLRAFVLAFSQCIPSMAYAMTLFYGSRLVVNEGLPYGNVFKVVEGVLYGAMVLGQSLAFTSDFQKGKIAARNIYKFLSRVPKVDIYSGKAMLDFNSRIKFNSIFFSYPSRSDILILNDLNLTINKGETVALVGSSGCGKSTVIQLLQRFYDCDRGDVLIDDINISELNLSWLRSKIGFVQQEPTLFSYSILENIAYGDNTRHIPLDEIVEAAKKANIHSFVESLPLGYQTSVGDKGSQLSGGQKQRIAIARALVRDPSILLLDEATSALDSESEKIVQDALNEAMKGRTCVVIAHRLSTIQNADKIMVLKDGRVIEQGNHQTLLAKKGAYFELLSKQN